MHVFLDLYGVLLDSSVMRRGFREAYAKLLAARFGGDPAVFARAHDRAGERHERRFDEADWTSSRRNAVEEELEVDQLRETLAEVGIVASLVEPLRLARELEFQGMSRVNARFPDARSAVERLRRAGHRIYLATGASESNARGALTGAGLEDAFDGIFTGETQDSRKDRLEFWTPIPVLVHAEPAVCILVDDRLDYLEPASRAGFTPLWMTRSAGSASTAPPSFVRATLTGLVGLPQFIEALAGGRVP